MRKTELKIGETYACTSRPQRGRYGWKPFKATLVALSGTQIVKEQKTVRKDGEVYVDTTKRTGIMVELAEPIERKRDEYILGRGYGPVSPEAQAVLKAHEGAKVTDVVTVVALENAGCFVSTWAEYEAEQKRKKQLETARALQMDKERKAEEAEADDAEERVLQARHKLAFTFGDEFTEIDRTDWRGATYRYGDYASKVRLEEKLGSFTKRPVDAEITLSMAALNSVNLGERFITTPATGWEDEEALEA